MDFRTPLGYSDGLVSALRTRHRPHIDATKLRYEDWDDLMEYCRYSASPVGRQLIDLHGENPAAYVASDALCSALRDSNRAAKPEC